MQTMTTVKTTRTPRARLVRLLTVALAGILLGLSSFVLVRAVITPHRTTPFYNPPVLAGQWIPGYCSAGVYARLGNTIVLTSSPHCAGDGVVAHDPDTGILLGTFGPTAQDASCPYPGHTCAASDMNYLVVTPAHIPWGHLNVIDLGTAGYRVLAPGTQPLGCADVAIGDPLELDGRGIYRTGTVAEKDPYLHPVNEDGSYFPCMMASTAQVGPGDSGSVVLVRGIPAGITSRTFGGDLGFTPLAEGLAELGLTMCTTPDCGLMPPKVGP
jgi:hypothetical protein